MSQNTGKEQGNLKCNKLDVLWDDLLSRQPERIRAAFASLATPEQQSVLAHLQRMVSETGWQPEQRISARAAIQTLDNQEK